MQASFIGISQVIPTGSKLDIKESIAKKDKNIKKKHSREWIQKRKERLLITEKRQKE